MLRIYGEGSKMKFFDPLTHLEINEINQEIALAEKQTSAEIVPVLVEKLKNNEISTLKISLHFLFGLQVMILLTVILFLNEEYSYPGLLLVLILVCIKFLIKKKMKSIERFSAQKEAEEEFLAQGIGETIGSNGVLLFIALKNRQVVILADHDLNDSQSDEKWVSVIQHFQESMKDQNLKEAIKNSIKELGILCKEIYPKTLSDTNEIKNEIRIKKS